MTPVVARPLTPAEAKLYAAARLHAVHVLMPYLAQAVFRLQPWAAEGLGTFGVDDSWRVLVDPDVMQRWGVRATAGVLLHEVGHALRDHAGGAQRRGPSLDRYAWNVCGDAAINDDLVAAGIELPVRPYLPADLRDREGRPMPTGGTVDAYYDALPVASHDALSDEEVPGLHVVAGRTGDPADSCGTVAGGPAHGVQLPPGAGAVSQAERSLTRRAVATSIARHRGDVPAGLRRWAGEALAPPAVSWQEQLRGAVRRGVAHAAGVQDTTYARPSRRRVPGVVLPGTRRPLPSVAVVVDTSASMRTEELDAALAEIEAIARSVGVQGQRLRVLTVDASVHESRSIAAARELVLVGGGGTDLRPGMAAAVEGRPVPDVVVTLTDGWTPWPSQPPRASTRWVVVVFDRGTEWAAEDPPAWCTTVRVPLEAA